MIILNNYLRDCLPAITFDAWMNTNLNVYTDDPFGVADAVHDFYRIWESTPIGRVFSTEIKVTKP